MGQGAGSSLRRPGIMVRQRLQMLGTAELKCAVVGESDGSCQCPGQMGREGQSPGPRTARTGRKADYAASARGLSARARQQSKGGGHMEPWKQKAGWRQLL